MPGLGEPPGELWMGADEGALALGGQAAQGAEEGREEDGAGQDGGEGEEGGDLRAWLLVVFS